MIPKNIRACQCLLREPSKIKQVLLSQWPIDINIETEEMTLRFANLAKFIARKYCKKLLITNKRILVISTTKKLKKGVYIKYRMYFVKQRFAM